VPPTIAPVFEELLLVWVGLGNEEVVELVAVAAMILEELVLVGTAELELELRELVVVWIVLVGLATRFPFDVATTKPIVPAPILPIVEAIGRVVMLEGLLQQFWSLPQHQVVSEQWII
jgi:hypothetical protein